MVREVPPRWLVLCETWRVPCWATCVACGVTAAIIGEYVLPSCRPLQLTDPTIGFPFAVREAFPTYSLAFVVILPVLLVYAPVVLLHSSTVLPAWREVNAWALVQALSFVLQFCFVNTFKVYAGRLRPDFVDRLRRAGLVVGSDPPLWANGTASAAAVCTTPYLQSNHELRDGHLSFPSGHSSTAFAAMVPLCLFLIARLRPFYHQSAWRLVVSLLPLVLAFFIAISRTLDYRHNFSDVLAGAVISLATTAVAVGIALRYDPSTGTLVVRYPTSALDSANVATTSMQLAAAEEGQPPAGSDGNVTTASRDHAFIDAAPAAPVIRGQGPFFPGLAHRKTTD